VWDSIVFLAYKNFRIVILVANSPEKSWTLFFLWLLELIHTVVPNSLPVSEFAQEPMLLISV
jgi:hypothetical protein